MTIQEEEIVFAKADYLGPTQPSYELTANSANESPRFSSTTQVYVPSAPSENPYLGSTSNGANVPYGGSVPTAPAAAVSTTTYTAPPPAGASTSNRYATRPTSAVGVTSVEGRPDRYNIPNHPDVPRPDVAQLKRRRRAAATTTGIVGGITGAIIGGPIGAVALGVGGGMLVKAGYKRKERRKMKKYSERVQAARASNPSSSLTSETPQAYGEFS